MINWTVVKDVKNPNLGNSKKVSQVQLNHFNPSRSNPKLREKLS